MIIPGLAIMATLAATSPVAPAAHGQASPALVLPATNPPATVRQRIGVTDVETVYNRPGVKGRQIFGSLVRYGQVWRTGSDSATRISFSTPVRIEGADVPAGTYELFTIPGPTSWTVIVHQNKSQWGSYAYDPANDVARVTVTPVAIPELVETFTIGFGDVTATSATMHLTWERTRVPVRIAVDTVAIVVPRIDAALKAEGRRPYFLAAMFYYENDLDIEKAAEWMAAAIAAQPTHIGMLHRQALILAKKGDRAGALAAAEKSLAGAQSAGPELKDEYTRLNNALIARLRGGG